jgi:hypothetical protein
VPGFGAYPFGAGPFGQYDWAKQTLFRDIPEIDRRLDAESPQDGRLEKWSDSVKEVFDEVLGFARDFGSLRDPDTVRTQFQGILNVTLLSATTTADGRVIEVVVDDPDPNDPLVPLESTSVGWILTDSDGREFTVNAVHKLHESGPLVELKGTAVEPVTEATSPGNGDATLRPPALIGLLGKDFGIEIDQHEAEAFQRSAVRDVVQWLDLKGAAKAYDILGKISGYRVTPLGLWRVDPVPDALPSESVFEAPLGSGKFYTELDPTRGFFDEIAADTIPLDFFCFETPDWDTDLITPPGTPGAPALPDDTSVEDAIGFTMANRPITASVDLGDGRWKVTIGPNTGTGDSFAGPVSDVITLTDVAGSFTANMSGGMITIVGATTSANNGTFLIKEVLGPTILTYVNASGVAEAFPGTWTIEPHSPVGALGYWFAEFVGMAGSFYLETFDDIGGGFFEFEVLVGDTPTFGATGSIKYDCRPAPNCAYCRASLLRLEVVPVEVLTEPDVLLDGVLGRLANKLLQVVPAHVRITDIVHIVTAEAALNITVSASSSSATFAAASVGYYYDIVPADVIETDPSHIAVSATVFTVP